MMRLELTGSKVDGDPRRTLKTELGFQGFPLA